MGIILGINNLESWVILLSLGKISAWGQITKFAIQLAAVMAIFPLSYKRIRKGIYSHRD